jgi:hypothetical protein
MVKVFKCNIATPIFARLYIKAMLLQFCYMTGCIDWLTDYTNGRIGLIEIIICYLCFLFVQIFFTNNDLSIKKKTLTVQSTLFDGIRHRTFEKNQIKEIIFKDEWASRLQGGNNWWSSILLMLLTFVIGLFIPPDYKWLTIVTKDNKRYTYYFFGIEYDYYDNAGDLLFEDVFRETAKSGVRVRWRSIKDDYFKHLQKNADRILSEKRFD